MMYMTDEEIRVMLQERKRAEKEAKQDAHWKEFEGWCEAVAKVGFTFLGIVAVL